MKSNNNIILTSLVDTEKEVSKKKDMPPGYIEVELSTKGKVGAPAVVHVRNFKVSEIIALSMTETKDIPIRLISILNDMIYEDTDVAQWHENEVTELMVYIFMTFYRSVIDDIPFPLNEEDIEYISNQENSQDKLDAIVAGKWVPKVAVNIGQDVDTYDLTDKFTTDITITNKKTGFHVTFGYIKYGDQITIRKWLDSYFAEDEARFEPIRKKLEYNRGINDKFKDTPEVIDKLLPISKEEEEEYDNYVIRRTQVITEVARLISIIDYDGQDVSDLSIGEKYELMSQDARIDYNLISKLAKRQEKMQFGLKPDVSMKNPITGEVVKRPLSFRIPALIQAMSVPRDDDYDDGFDDED